MLKIFTKLTVFFIVLLLGKSILAQTQPKVDISFLDNKKITIDGFSDPIWEQVSETLINKPFQNETPSLISATWKAVWNTKGIYVLIEVEDDVWMPSFKSGQIDWLSDKPELYFDVSDPLKDGGGPYTGNGNYQVAPDFSNTLPGVEKEHTTGQFIEGDSVLYAESYDNLGKYTMEYFVPFAVLIDNNGNTTDPQINKTIGFDVTIIDVDLDLNGTRQRAVWSNIGQISESYFVMDDAGLINFIQDTADLFYTQFTASKTTIELGEAINFTDLSEGDATKWLWNFGDGNTSSLKDPVYTYSKKGIYTVSLSTSNSENSDIETKVDYINVIHLIPPIADFEVDVTEITINSAINFTDLSANTPTSWAWDFGDGNSSIVQNPTYSYSTTGTYSVSLTVSNEDGKDSINRKNFIVVKGFAPIADFTADITESEKGQTVNFSDLSENNPTSWLWDFGDGDTSEMQNPSHVFVEDGIYSVSLKSINYWGADTLVKEDFIKVINTVLSIVNYKKDILIYPNPSKGKFYLKTEINMEPNLNIVVLDFSGKVILNIQKLGETNKEIDLSNYSNGIYFIKITGVNYIQTEKVIKN